MPGADTAAFMKEGGPDYDGRMAYILATGHWSGNTTADSHIRADIATGSPKTTDGKVIAEALDKAPAIDHDLFRGLGTRAVGDIEKQTGKQVGDLKVGDEFKVGPSSFSMSEREGRSFTDNVGGHYLDGSHPSTIEMQNKAIGLDKTPSSPYDEHQVTIQVDSGARGAPVMGLSQYPNEKEVISGGTFRVTAPTSSVERVFSKGTPIETISHQDTIHVEQVP